jgi:hypothetical protein
VSYHIASINDSYNTLKILNDLYDTQYELELIQLMVKHIVFIMVPEEVFSHYHSRSGADRQRELQRMVHKDKKHFDLQ